MQWEPFDNRKRGHLIEEGWGCCGITSLWLNIIVGAVGSVGNALTTVVHSDQRDAARQADWTVGLNGDTEGAWSQPVRKKDSPIGAATEANHDFGLDNLDLRSEEA